MNADGTHNLTAEERRQLREEASARRAAEIRDGLKRVHMERLERRIAAKAALADGSACEKLKAALGPPPKRYIPISGRARTWSA
jgi:hypothetical protein